jgi:Tol biopolymer transport system component
MVRGKVKRFDLADGSSLELAATPNVWALSWSRQGLVMFRGGEGRLSVVPASGGSVRSATYGSDTTKQTPVIDGTPQFLSDGQRFLIASDRAEGPMRLDLATLESSERKTVVEQTSGGAMVARTPHGESYLLYAKGTALVAHRFDESAGRVIGAPEPIVQNIGKVGGGLQVATMTASDAGTLAYQRAGNAMGDRLVWIDRHGKEVGEMPAAVVGSPRAISPDGRYVAMNKSNQLWSLDLSRQVATQLTFGEGEVDDAVWSPDGRRVAFQRDAGIYEKDSSGSGDERLLVPGRLNAISSWSPDGRYVLVSEGPRMFMVPLGDGKRLGAGSASGTSREGVFSPDGKFIAYTSDESGRSEVYVQPVPPAVGKWKISSEGGDRPSWRKDGKELFFRSNGGITAIGVKSGSTFEPAVPQRLFANISNRGYVATTDGQRYLMGLVVESGTDAPITVVLNWFLLLSNRGGSRP